MKYREEDIERIFRMAVSNVEWALERFNRLDGIVDVDPACHRMGEAILEMTNARNKWRGAVTKS